jgi:NAD(P)-dependent dehydrogenase (short-subunit alcohol dehydrogenase family)
LIGTGVVCPCLHYNTRMQTFDLSNKTAIITGASRGIGLAIAESYAEAGARVVLSSRRQESLDQAARGIRERGGEALSIAAHTGDPQAVQFLVDKVIETFGGVDILVNNAGTNPHFGPILTSEESHWEKILNVNLRGYFRAAKACVERMKLHGGGKIINMASVSGLQAYPGLGVYSVSKAGVLMLTQVLAAELAPFNIQVNAIAPGVIDTRFSRMLVDTPQISQALLQHIPAGRFGKPEDITGIALYLASNASDYTTGATFVVDGGQLATGVTIPA